MVDLVFENWLMFICFHGNEILSLATTEKVSKFASFSNSSVNSQQLCAENMDIFLQRHWPDVQRIKIKSNGNCLKVGLELLQVRDKNA